MPTKHLIAGILNYGLLPGSGNILLGYTFAGGCQTVVSIALFTSLVLFTIQGFQMALALAIGENPEGYLRNLWYMVLTMLLLGIHMLWVSRTFGRALKRHHTPPPLQS